MPDGKQLEILIVEDDSVNSMLLEAMLLKTNLAITNITKAETLESAKAILKQSPTDVILLDLNLPDSGGLATLDTVLKKYPRKPIIVITGEHDEHVGLEAISMGAQEYLLKGKFNVDTLSKSIRYSIGRKDSEAHARQKERIFQTLIASLPQKILLKNKESQFVYCNEKYAESLGLNVDQVIGKTDFNFYPNELAEKYIQSDQEAINSNITLEHLFRHVVDDVEYVTRVLKTAVQDESGKSEGVLCVFEDFTERIKSEEGLKKVNLKLKNTNRQMKEMQSQLVQTEKMASIGQLAAGIAHEINNPMGFVASNFSTLKKYIGSIIDMCKTYESFLETLQGDQGFDLEKEIQNVQAAKKEFHIDYIVEDIPELFEDSTEGMQRIIKIVKNLRDFSRIDQIEDFADINLAESMRSTLVVISNEVKYAADVVTDFKDIPDVFCNAGQLNQVFLNILVNAAQAIAEQQRSDRGLINIKIFDDDGWAVCQICDNGPGIGPEHLSKIFDPFFTTKPAGKGTGLGLNLSYDIVVNKHKGQLLADSQAGEGTTFTIKIPRNLETLLTQKEGVQNEKQEHCTICG